MATVMSWGNSEGTKGRCDAKCHNARRVECSCMCGGHFHGASRDGTLQEEIRRHGEEILREARRRAAAEGLELEARDLGEVIAILTAPRQLTFDFLEEKPRIGGGRPGRRGKVGGAARRKGRP